MNDSRRSVDHGDGTDEGSKPRKCDHTGRSDTSPDWAGAGWYRIMAGSSTRIPESPPGKYHCGTFAAGWMKGSHPTVARQSNEEVTFCFDGKGYAEWSNCQISTQGKVTHCGDFFVYYLENTPNCNLRYCATDRF